MIEKRLNSAGRVRWRVRYRTPDQRQRSRTFDRRRDAEDFEAELRGRMRRGEFVGPQRGRMSLASLWEEYERISLTYLRKTTQQNYRVAIQHALNQFKLWPIGKIEHGDIADWVASLSKTKGPETVRYAHRVLCLVLEYGVSTRRLAHNAARGVELPARPPARERILTAEQVDALAEKLDRHGDIVLCMAYLGLRWSEAAGLRAGHVDLTRNRVRIIERATEVAGHMDVDIPKTATSARDVGIPAFLRDVLSARIEGRRPNDLVFPAPAGGHLRNGNWRSRSGWDEATASLGLKGITPHDLRRTFGSLARLAGADLRWIQKAMGHASITTTARIYAHLYDNELDTVAEALNDLRRPK
jgi:integrase